MAGRNVPEWIGKNPDAAIPATVRLRIFERAGGVCALSGRKITPADKWDVDHIKPLSMGGEHRETNLQPVLRDKHREKTASEAPARAKADRIRRKMQGLKPASTFPHGRGSGWKRKITGEVVRRGE